MTDITNTPMYKPSQQLAMLTTTRDFLTKAVENAATESHEFFQDRLTQIELWIKAFPFASDIMTKMVIEGAVEFGPQEQRNQHQALKNQIYLGSSSQVRRAC